jgi:hypothetical protein
MASIEKSSHITIQTLQDNFNQAVDQNMTDRPKSCQTVKIAIQGMFEPYQNQKRPVTLKQGSHILREYESKISKLEKAFTNSENFFLDTDAATRARQASQKVEVWLKHHFLQQAQNEEPETNSSSSSQATSSTSTNAIPLDERKKDPLDELKDELVADVQTSLIAISDGYYDIHYIASDTEALKIELEKIDRIDTFYEEVLGAIGHRNKQWPFHIQGLQKDKVLFIDHVKASLDKLAEIHPEIKPQEKSFEPTRQPRHRKARRRNKNYSAASATTTTTSASKTGNIQQGK